MIDVSELAWKEYIETELSHEDLETMTAQDLVEQMSANGRLR